MERICHVWKDGKDVTCIVVDTQISVLMRHLWKDDEKLLDDVPKRCCFPTSSAAVPAGKACPDVGFAFNQLLGHRDLTSPQAESHAQHL